MQNKFLQTSALILGISLLGLEFAHADKTQVCDHILEQTTKTCNVSYAGTTDLTPCIAGVDSAVHWCRTFLQ